MRPNIIRAVRVSSAAPRASTRLVAWSGGAIFVLSLSYFLFSYAVTFRRPATAADSTEPITWNVALFTVFAMHHSVFARERVRRWIAELVPPGLERSFYVWVASLLFIAVCALWRPVPGVAWDADGVTLWILRALQLGGGVLALAGALALDALELSGIRQMEGRSRADAPAGSTASEFRTSGPYGRVRHPIYLGWILMVLPASPMTMTRLVFAVVSCAYLVVAIPFEERSLRATSGGAYERYMNQVPWKLIPGVF
jgi:protein-S-isoprenylcysteine O-methyltransferase Ste14